MTIDLPITTRRLVMRDFVADDWQAVHAYASDPEVVRYMPFGPNTEQESREFVTRCTEEQFRSPRENFQLAVVVADAGLLIGSIGVGLNPSADGKEAALGYCYRRDAWGQGYATETAHALIGFAFERLGAHQVHAGCDTRNTASARALEKAGLRYEGTSLRGPSGNENSGHYAILEADWRALARQGGVAPAQV